MKDRSNNQELMHQKSEARESTAAISSSHLKCFTYYSHSSTKLIFTGIQLSPNIILTQAQPHHELLISHTLLPHLAHLHPVYIAFVLLQCPQHSLFLRDPNKPTNLGETRKYKVPRKQRFSGY